MAAKADHRCICMLGHDDDLCCYSKFKVTDFGTNRKRAKTTKYTVSELLQISGRSFAVDSGTSLYSPRNMVAHKQTKQQQAIREMHNAYIYNLACINN